MRYDDFEFIKFPIHTRTGLLVYNVPGLCEGGDELTQNYRLKTDLANTKPT